MLEKSLTDFGLTPNEAKIYVATLEFGQVLASSLSRKTGINRSSVYTIINSLKKKGLLGVFNKHGVDYFCAADPEVLWTKEESFLLSQKARMNKLSEIITELNALQRQYLIKPRVHFYEGLDGIKYVYEDTLKNGVKEIFSFWGADVMPAEIKNYLFEDYMPRRLKKGIPVYIVAPDLEIGQMVKKSEHRLNRPTVLIPAETYPFDMEIDIYGDKVGFMSYKHDEVMGFIVESKAISHQMKMIHQVYFNYVGKHNLSK